MMGVLNFRIASPSSFHSSKLCSLLLTMTPNTSVSSPISTLHYPKLPLILLLTTLTILIIILFQFESQSLGQAFPFVSTTKPSTETSTLVSKLRDSVTFLPLKDLRFSHSPATGHTWFMSSVNDIQEPDESEHIFFPSDSSKGRILCLSAHDHSDGTKNLYAFTYPDALPYNSTFLHGLTIISDTYYDYSNLWHGLGAVVPSVAWHEKNKCVRPERWVLFHWGELRTEMGQWVKTLTEATIGNEVRIEGFGKYENVGPVCFERAVVFRHNDGGLSRERREQVYDMMRCKARAYCKVVENFGDMNKIRLTLLMRVGGRAFKNETTVIRVFDKECKKVDGCVLKIARPNNLTFCDQVSEFLLNVSIRSLKIF